MSAPQVQRFYKMNHFGGCVKSILTHFLSEDVQMIRMNFLQLTSFLFILILLFRLLISLPLVLFFPSTLTSLSFLRRKFLKRKVCMIASLLLSLLTTCLWVLCIFLQDPLLHHEASTHKHWVEYLYVTETNYTRLSAHLPLPAFILFLLSHFSLISLWESFSIIISFSTSRFVCYRPLWSVSVSVNNWSEIHFFLPL